MVDLLEKEHGYIKVGEIRERERIIGIIKKYGFHIDVIEYKKMIKEIESKKE